MSLVANLDQIKPSFRSLVSILHYGIVIIRSFTFAIPFLLDWDPHLTTITALSLSASGSHRASAFTSFNKVKWALICGDRIQRGPDTAPPSEESFICPWCNVGSLKKPATFMEHLAHRRRDEVLERFHEGLDEPGKLEYRYGPGRGNDRKGNYKEGRIIGELHIFVSGAFTGHIVSARRCLERDVARPPHQGLCSLEPLISEEYDLLVLVTSLGYPRPSGLVGIGAFFTNRLAPEISNPRLIALFCSACAQQAQPNAEALNHPCRAKTICCHDLPRVNHLLRIISRGPCPDLQHSQLALNLLLSVSSERILSIETLCHPLLRSNELGGHVQQMNDGVEATATEKLAEDSRKRGEDLEQGASNLTLSDLAEHDAALSAGGGVVFSAKCIQKTEVNDLIRYSQNASATTSLQVLGAFMLCPVHNCLFRALDSGMKRNGITAWSKWTEWREAVRTHLEGDPSWGYPKVEAAMRERVRAAALNSFGRRSTISVVEIDLVELFLRSMCISCLVDALDGSQAVLVR
ncbi:hypothetical protein FFLO_06484 [Filobasidium floriforme]|uniref:Uncharacterized protein n=1 Tax=Filobasidium floriforme TaxID=5210 RepID=A0A8K0NQE6_9TREE|nr:uncharacterized protein HD553DRAFT_365904 [Filobasidium floriforme]KAG7527967.1 hypothetical protein FFLO_06484 [Filobasidium floriforme]KAH8077662.1 hypothetical protein HD553DRAFT_365904 [Filobasidium floriforme]